MKPLTILTCILLLIVSANAQSKIDSLKTVRDSALRAAIKADSAKINKEYDGLERWVKVESKLEYPYIKGGKYSGVIPVANPTEIPDPNIEYKLLFELTNFTDSTAKDISDGINEVVRVINLHVASGILPKKIIPVLVVHAGALHYFKNNTAYQKKFKTDNPNLALLHELQTKLGAKFIACGQAMEFVNVKKEELIPEMLISYTAKTVITGYQLKGFVLLHE
jgi:intracellular sulfur oxidation DsrE/DsrF family protein